MSATELTRSKPSLRVLEAIADAEDVSPIALEPPLNDVVDPAALDRLFEPTDADDSVRGGHVSFRYRGYDVIISSGGAVKLS
ncbi:HalOD1 output domain-containing protein [Natrinema soli]|uniref:HalOD1 output domain-containing protein n=1 Tax=Natrinema soli TaxID=1930624 RepID=A0ABD5SXA7_9EURY|nr:HalOD1 output domain-containing protein [Natrinema soli]